MSEIHNKIISYFKNKDNPIILDVGSFRLEDSIIFSNLFPNGKIYSFECDSRNINAVNRMDYPDNIMFIEAAIGSIDGSVDFYPSNDVNFNTPWFLSGSLRSPKVHLQEHTVRFGKPVKVSCQRLDTWYKNSDIYGQIIQLAYVDTNGAENDFIDGGLETLKFIDLLYIEVFEKEMYSGEKPKPFIINRLKELGFELLFEHGHNICVKNIKLNA